MHPPLRAYNHRRGSMRKPDSVDKTTNHAVWHELKRQFQSQHGVPALKSSFRALKPRVYPCHVSDPVPTSMVLDCAAKTPKLERSPSALRPPARKVIAPQRARVSRGYHKWIPKMMQSCAQHDCTPFRLFQAHSMGSKACAPMAT